MGFKKLFAVGLNGNICISQDFFGPQTIGTLESIVTEKCGHNHVFDFDCGEVLVMSVRIQGGSEVKHGSWPFLVALLHIASGRFFCGGTLITKQHILTGS